MRPEPYRPGRDSRTSRERYRPSRRVRPPNLSGLRRGGVQRNPKMSDEDARMVRNLRGVATAASLARELGVSPAAVSHIWTDKNWGWQV